MENHEFNSQMVINTHVLFSNINTHAKTINAYNSLEVLQGKTRQLTNMIPLAG